MRDAMAFVLTDADKAVQHASPFSFPWPLGSQFSMMGLSELKAAISLENDSVASSERQRIMKWTVDDVMSHVRSLGCTEQAKIFADQVSEVLLQNDEGQFCQFLLVENNSSRSLKLLFFLSTLNWVGGGGGF